ncbi:MAG: 23S rRNA (adenine(2503)-C(2))-methyltransferase RlmN [Elusimicrobia bacterium]|nr:23S rRNA (adenine(2503)-C(2))-methyltransferase RlmN [Elusimicrobiota bacterium]
MTPERLRELLASEPAYRIKQAARAIFERGASSFAEITELPAALRQSLKDEPILSMTPETVRVSASGDAHKAVMRLKDGKRIETVLMSPKPDHWTTCISSQVGCALRCTFCATGLMGFDRNLTPEEITDQVLFWRQYMASETGGAVPKDARLSNVVYMGMGEPMLNLENVFESLRRLSDPAEFGIGQRHIAVSTAGIAPGMERFGRNFPQVNLALSLHSAIPELRTSLVPINKAYPLHRLKRALQEYFRSNNRKVFLEYVLLAGENDRRADADALVEFIKDVGSKHLLHVNLIVWNPTRTRHVPSTSDAARKFIDVLDRAGISATIRKNLGQDIQGACGQLVIEKKRK